MVGLLPIGEISVATDAGSERLLAAQNGGPFWVDLHIAAHNHILPPVVSGAIFGADAGSKFGACIYAPTYAAVAPWVAAT
jgi:hypothetical protein